MLIAVFSESETPQSKIKRLIFGKLIPTYVCNCKQTSESPILYFLMSIFLVNLCRVML